jgi:hypothetical protein
MPVSISGTTGYAGPLGAITVDTGSIVNNAVTPAKMSRTGTSGQVLTSNGAGADPSYTTLPTSVTSAVAGNGVAVSAATGAVTFSLAGPSAGSVGTHAIATPNAGSYSNGAVFSYGTGGLTGSTFTSMYRNTRTLICGCAAWNTTTYNPSLSGTWMYLGAPQGGGIMLVIRIA